ncbi:MAG: ABC transporter permease subunit [Chloroflexi bacterium]|nr:ABC transporter permease subunit [Chloroflexota bacterium]MBM3173806.1 ABC transporter permease subunit [Chloroflexota bacterium]
MEEIWNGFVKAIQLIVTLDPVVMEITGRSLAIAAASCLLASLVCIPLGSLIHFNRFPGKRGLVNVIQTLYSVPTVVIGLLIFLLFSRAGPLGDMGLLFTPTVMVIGQAVLIAPILVGLTITALSGVDNAIPETASALGADGIQAAVLTMREARFGMLTAIVMGFGRAISEVGLALMVGGNIAGFTRVLTTAIALESSKGDIELSIALGIILIAVALIINIALNRLQQRK